MGFSFVIIISPSCVAVGTRNGEHCMHILIRRIETPVFMCDVVVVVGDFKFTSRTRIPVDMPFKNVSIQVRLVDGHLCIMWWWGGGDDDDAPLRRLIEIIYTAK